MGIRRDEVWNADAIPKVEEVQLQERGIGGILQEINEMMKTSDGQGMLSVSVPASCYASVPNVDGARSIKEARHLCCETLCW